MTAPRLITRNWNGRLHHEIAYGDNPKRNENRLCNIVQVVEVTETEAAMGLTDLVRARAVAAEAGDYHGA